MSEYRGFGGAVLALAFLFGGAVGACFALLYAPESGTRTRERIRRHTEGLREWAVDVAEDVRERVGEASEQDQPTQIVEK